MTRVALVILLAIGLAMGLATAGTGCEPKDEGQEDAPGGQVPGSLWTIGERVNPSAGEISVPEGVIPFVVSALEPRGSFFLGYWDTKAGRVTFDPLPLFELDAQGYTQVVWDGGNRMGLLTDPPGLVPGDPRPTFVLDTIVPSAEYPTFVAACPSRTSDLAVLTYDPLAPEPSSGLQVTSGIGAEAQGDVFTSEIPGFPVSLNVEAAGIEAVLFAWDGEATGEGRFRVYELRRGVLAAGPVSPVMSIVMAGAGARFGRAGSRVYVAFPGVDVSHWDLDTGRVVRDEHLNTAMKAYQDKYAPHREFESPPTLYGFRGTLVSVYRPGAYDPVLDASGRETGSDWYDTMYIAALSGDAIVGEVICDRGKLIVKKGGVVTQQADLAPEHSGYWQFPDAEPGE